MNAETFLEGLRQLRSVHSIVWQRPLSLLFSYWSISTNELLSLFARLFIILFASKNDSDDQWNEEHR